MGTYYSSLGISSGMIGGAIAAAVIHDVVVNDLGLQGFPGISVRRTDDGFGIALSFADQHVSFDITDLEAKAAVEQMRRDRTHYRPIFDRVQDGLATLEGLTRR